MRAILSLSVVCLLTAVWTLVILWMTGVLMAEEVRADFQSPAALAVALPPGEIPVVEQPPTDSQAKVTVVQVRRSPSGAPLGLGRDSADGETPIEGPRAVESAPVAKSGKASPAALIAAAEESSTKNTPNDPAPQKNTAKKNTAKKPTAKKPAGKNAAGKNKRKRSKQPAASKSANPTVAEAVSPESPAEFPAAPAGIEPEPEVVAPVLCVCSGRVLTPGGQPLAGYMVQLDLGTEVLRATTDELGEFLLGLGASAPDGLVSARVREPAGNLVHFSELRAGVEVELLVRPAERLGGRLETQPPADYLSLEVAVILPAVEGLHAEILLGSAALDAEGNFLLEGTEPSPTDEYRLRFHHGNATLAVAEVSRELLLEGQASIQIELARLDLRVRDLAGVPIPGARVSLVRFGPGGSVESATIGTILCDERGRAAAELQTGSWELCLSAPGYAPQALSRDLSSGRITCRIDATLQRLGSEDLVRGEVLSADGKPVVGALVTARPPSRYRDLSAQFAASTRTDKRGRFELSLDLDALTILEAEHPFYGRVVQAAVAPGFRKASLRFHPRYTIKVGVSRDKAGGTQLKGRVRYALVDSAGNLSASGVAEPPLLLRGLDAGDYELFAVSLNTGAGGRGPVQVTAPDRGTPARGALLLSTWPSTHGIALTSEGVPLSGLIVTAELSDWPAALAFACARTVTDESGRFQLQLPTDSPQTLILQDGARVLSTTTIEPGDECEFTVR